MNKHNETRGEIFAMLGWLIMFLLVMSPYIIAGLSVK